MIDKPEKKNQKSHPFPFLLRTDRIGFIKSLRNKLKTIQYYNRVKKLKGLRSRQDFIQAVLNPSPSLSNFESPIAKASRLWLLERIARQARSFDNGSFLLRDPNLERFKPILHVGWGMDVIAETGFDFLSFSQIVEKSADPKYRPLVFEAAGVICVAATQPIKSALIGIRVPQSFSKDGLERFFRFINQPEVDEMSHGYGRGLYFKKFTLRSALKQALSCPSFFHSGLVVRGVGFAFAMVNCASLQEVFSTVECLKKDKLGLEEIKFFQEGVVTAVSFLEWNFPGLLDTLETSEFSQNAWKKFRSYLEAGGVFSLL